MNYVHLAETLRNAARVFCKESQVCEDEQLASACMGNSLLYAQAAQAVEELMARLVRQACYYEEIEAREDE